MGGWRLSFEVDVARERRLNPDAWVDADDRAIVEYVASRLSAGHSIEVGFGRDGGGFRFPIVPTTVRVEPPPAGAPDPSGAD